MTISVPFSSQTNVFWVVGGLGEQDTTPSPSTTTADTDFCAQVTESQHGGGGKLLPREPAFLMFQEKSSFSQVRGTTTNQLDSD